MRMEAAERGAIGKGKGDGGVEEEAGLGRGDWGAGMEWEVVGGREGGSLGGGGFFQTSGGGGEGGSLGGGFFQPRAGASSARVRASSWPSDLTRCPVSPAVQPPLRGCPAGADVHPDL